MDENHPRPGNQKELPNSSQSPQQGKRKRPDRTRKRLQVIWEPIAASEARKALQNAFLLLFQEFSDRGEVDNSAGRGNKLKKHPHTIHGRNSF
jgi:hypothetical protein